MLHGVVGLLLTTVAGYWVLERAEGHKGQLKKVGQFLGALIIVVSVLGLACSLWCFASGKTGYCPGGMGKGWFCPYGSKAAPPPATSR
jgi:hypothetical protein